MVDEINTADNSQIGDKPSPRKKHPAKRRPKRKKGKVITSKTIIHRFAACGRCSYFLSTVRLVNDPARFETAVAQIESNRLTLEWDIQMRNLVNKSYGIRLDLPGYYWEGCCPECRRTLICKTDSSEEDPAYFSITV